MKIETSTSGPVRFTVDSNKGDNDKARAAAIYADKQIQLQNLLGRVYYNPLGEQPFELLRRLLGTKKISVLDAGCGRGQTTLWWAKHNDACVDAFDPSWDMLSSAAELIETNGLSGKINFWQAKIDNFNSAKCYDLVIAHDVLCYSPNIVGDFSKLLSWVKPDRIISISGYSCDVYTTAAANVINSWGIQLPPGYDEISALLNDCPALVLLCNDTSRQYRRHWQKMRLLLDDNWLKVVELVGESEAQAFSQRTDAILSAVSEGNFGHWWAVLAK
ncbi:MAG: class I SAM-dependent methyltransferase [Negativicutes bacterium]|jgi:2-polyprenyl-3-methyl-5-hydroxy-6-metoxy-1,4-benzoquinol methylase